MSRFTTKLSLGSRFLWYSEEVSQPLQSLWPRKEMRRVLAQWVKELTARELRAAVPREHIAA